MFDFIIKTENVDGIVITRKFDTASDFLEACESNDIDIAVSMDDPIISVTYGEAEVDTEQLKTVDELYYWMCSDVCDWF